MLFFLKDICFSEMFINVHQNYVCFLVSMIHHSFCRDPPALAGVQATLGAMLAGVARWNESGFSHGIAYPGYSFLVVHLFAFLKGLLEVISSFKAS